MSANQKKRALVILHEGVEELEAVAPIDILRRSAVVVVTAATADDKIITGRSGIALQADVQLDAVSDDLFDCIVLPGGPGIQQSVRTDRRVHDVLLAHYTAQKWIAAICAAPLVLNDLGLLNNIGYTAHPSTRAELPAAIMEPCVHVARNFITATGAGVAIPFGLKILEILTNEAVAKKVAESMGLPLGSKNV